MLHQRILFLLISLCYFVNSINGQSIHLATINLDKNSPLNKLFLDYRLVKIQYEELKSAVSIGGNRHNIHLQGQDQDWNLVMFDHDIYANDFVLKLGTDHGVETLHKKPDNKTMTGYLKSEKGGQASLVVADHYLAGMVEQNGVTFFIEPAKGVDPTLPSDYLLIYNTNNVIQNTSIQCGFDIYRMNEKSIVERSKRKQHKYFAGCYTVELAISNDYTVFQKRGSQADVENWNATILTIMATNFDNEFSSRIEFVQSASFIATTSIGDPWNGIGDIYAQLDKHRAWANGGGYGTDYDIATNWTTKFTSGLLGLAWYGTICTSYEYNVCSDFGGSNLLEGQLAAHEMGHSFNCVHDANGSPYIMAPFINSSTKWSSKSILAVNAFVKSRSCLSVCSVGSPPEANFNANPTEECIPFSVQFTDLSPHEPTSWQWTFPGGTPSTSSEQNPQGIIYKSFGLYDVTLKVSNNYGTNTVTFKKYISAKDKPNATFNSTIKDRTIFLTNTSYYGTSVEWEFGDGLISNEDNPVHTYLDDGVYNVILKAKNECGISEIIKKITIVTSPVAMFIADTTRGCTSLKIKYKNQSSKNGTSWSWEFPGGTPSTSNLYEPVVTYKIHGVFDVKLTAKNSKYSSQAVKLKYITADTLPLAEFDTLVNGGVVSFTNKSNNANSYLWDFGDGTTSSELNPSHSYVAGTYLAKLTVNNPCGAQSIIKQITIPNLLHIGFKVDQSKGCAPYAVQYTNTSIGAKFYLWSFPGGTPCNSTEQNPMVIYKSPGKYQASLTAGNNKDTLVFFGSDFIEVEKKTQAYYISLVSGSTVYFTNQTKNGINYYWDFGDGDSSHMDSPNHQYKSEGEYIVTLISSNDCSSDTIIQTIAVYLVPKLNFNSDASIICGSGKIQFNSKTSSDVHRWLWYFDGGNPKFSDEKNPSVYYKQKGSFSVKLTVHNSNGENELVKQAYIKVIPAVLCPDYTFSKNSNLNEGMIEPLKGDQTENPQIYPNPFKGIINVHGRSNANEIQLSIIDLFGKEIYNETLQVINGQYKEEKNFDYLKDGVYLINLKSVEDNFTRTIFLTR